jgi:pimeloyl-ACP methyl ester carboxylesterase
MIVENFLEVCLLYNKSARFKIILEIGFFLGANVEDILLGNLRSFLAWAMYQRSYDAIASPKEYDDLEYIVHTAQEKLQVKFKDGHNPDVSHLKMTMEPIMYLHRPLFIYVFSYLKNIAGDAIFRCYGFERGQLGVAKYWIRLDLSSTKQPMLFFHGISTGWIFYLPLILKLARSRSIVLVDLDAIMVNSFQFEMPTETEFVNSVRSILIEHFGKNVKASIVGHSFGSILSAWLLRSYPEMVSHLTLIDPVSLLLGLPDVAYNFLYKPPTTLLGHLIRIMASRELTVSHMLHRHFWWYNNILWLEDLPLDLNIVVALAGRDEITNPKTIMEYINICDNSSSIKSVSKSPMRLRSKKQRKIETLYWPNATHASILVDSDDQNELEKAIATSEEAEAFKEST